jgi:hypothetical protein
LLPVSIADADDDVERGSRWLLGFADLPRISERVELLRSALVHLANSELGPSNAYGPVRDDRVAWYLLLAHTASEAPTNLDIFQAARVLPIFSALGRNLEALAQVRNVDYRVKALVYPASKATSAMLGPGSCQC